MLVQIACSLQKNLENENRQRTENRRARHTSAGRRKVRPTSAGCALIMYRYSNYCSCRCCCASVFQSQRTPLDCRSHWDHSSKRPLCHSNADLVISATSSPATSGLSSKARRRCRAPNLRYDQPYMHSVCGYPPRALISAPTAFKSTLTIQCEFKAATTPNKASTMPECSHLIGAAWL
jgi:hypothetical protein